MSRFTIIDNQPASIMGRAFTGCPPWPSLKIDHELVGEVIMQKRIERERTRKAQTGIPYYEDDACQMLHPLLPLPRGYYTSRNDAKQAAREGA